MRKISVAIIFISLLILASACSREEPIYKESRTKITLVMNYYAAGDFGYNDLIFEGVYKAASKLDAEFSIFRYDNDEILRSFVNEWSKDFSYDSSMLIFASGDIASKVSDMQIDASNHLILAVEAEEREMPKGCRTFTISRYGTSYLVGCMAAENPSPIVLAARPDDPVLISAIDGFIDGYSFVNNAIKPEIIYLSEDETGFSNPSDAYMITGSIASNSFVFPLAGGSNAGIYKFVRDHEFSEIMVCGMDTDCSSLCPRAPFSLTVSVDKVLMEVILSMFDSSTPENSRYDLSTGYTDIKINPMFYDNLIVWQDYYDSPDYWDVRKNKYLKDALVAEEQRNNNK